MTSHATSMCHSFINVSVWARCACGWTGPYRDSEQDADEDAREHVQDASLGMATFGQEEPPLRPEIARRHVRVTFTYAELVLIRDMALSQGVSGPEWSRLVDKVERAMKRREK